MMDWSPIFISMKTASLSILVTFFIGLIVAWGIVKMKNDKIKIALDSVFTLPLVLPPTVVGFFLLWIFGVRGPIGRFFIDFFAVKIAFSWYATVIAAVVMSFPRSIWTSGYKPLGCWTYSGNVWMENFLESALCKCIAWNNQRRYTCLCQRSRRIRSNCNACGKYCRTNPNTAYGGLFWCGCRKYGKRI